MNWRHLPAVTRHRFAPFAILAGLGLLLALGRYDWRAAPALAARAYVLSAFFFLLTTGAIATTLTALGRTALIWRLLIPATLLLNLPWYWLRLDRWCWPATKPQFFSQAQSFVPEWLRLADFQRLPTWHSTDWLFCGLLAIGLLGLLLRPSPRSCQRFFFGLFALIVVQAWLHQSNRSPYSYIPFFERPPQEQHAYTVALLPDGRGHVNRDVLYFTRLEELFTGIRADTPTLLVRRAYPFYLSAHFSYFAGHYHTFIVLNLLLWLAAALSLHRLCHWLTGSTTAAAIAAWLVACSPGFVMYATQPMSYLIGFASIAIAVCLYHKLLIATALKTPAAISAAGLILGLTLLTYDSAAWMIFFAAYPLLHGQRPWRALLAIAIGAAIYIVFLTLIFRVFAMPREAQNDIYLVNSANSILGLVRHPSASLLLPLLTATLGNYAAQVLQTMFYVPALIAFLGVWLATLSPLVRRTGLLLLLPSFASYAFLSFGQTYLSTLSRFNYPAYPAIILLASATLAAAAAHCYRHGHPWLSRFVVAAPAVLCLLLANADAFCAMPHLYFHFYYQTGGFFP